MATVSQANLIIFSSQNGRDHWELVRPEDVPEWLKAPDVMARLVAGEECMNARESDNRWFYAEPVPSEDEIRRIVSADQKNARKNARRVLQ